MKKLKKIIVKYNLMNIPALLFYFFRIFKIKKEKIIFINFNGKGYGDSPKYICEELLKSNIKLDLVWVVNNLDDIKFPEEVRKVKKYSLKYFYELSTANVWINNSRFDSFVKKRKKQLYIQTWHGGLALKKIEYDAYDKLSEYYKKVIINDNKMIDIMISNSEFCTQMYKRGFKFNKDILEIGTPRNDKLLKYNEIEIDEIKKKFNIEKDEKILLYAPTFRDSYINNPYDVDFEKIKAILEKKTNCKWKIVIRLHPKVKNPSELIVDIEKYIDATFYNDMQELILISDLLITDYSSTMFEAMISNKPAVIYAKDIKDYYNERGVYFNFEELPFPFAKNNNELANKVRGLENTKVINCYNNFKEKVKLNESGKASYEISKIILERVKE